MIDFVSKGAKHKKRHTGNDIRYHRPGVDIKGAVGCDVVHTVVDGVAIDDEDDSHEATEHIDNRLTNHLCETVVCAF